MCLCECKKASAWKRFCAILDRSQVLTHLVKEKDLSGVVLVAPDFDLFYQKFSKKAERTDDLNEAVLIWNWPNYTILQSVSGHEGKTDASEPYYPTTVKTHFKAIYFETKRRFLVFPQYLQNELFPKLSG